MSPARPSHAARLPLLVYRGLFPLVFLLMLPGFLLRIIRRGNYRHRFGQRFGRFSADDRRALAPGGWTWIHAVSVGEMMMALRLARALQAARPGMRLLLSTTTSTGFAVAREQRARLPEPVELIYYPLDLAGIVRRVLDLVRPERLVLVDKELWPNMITECDRRAIPVSIVNARLSPKSERGFLRWRRWVAPFFAMLETVCVQEPEEVDRWSALGVRREALVCTGSIKFDFGTPEGSRAPAFRALLEPLGVRFELGNGERNGERNGLPPPPAAATPLLLGGSTFPGEEAALGRVLLELRPRWPGLRLVVVPRHVERTPEVQAALRELGLRTVLRSELVPASGVQTTEAAEAAEAAEAVDGVRDGPDVLLVDTTGELRDWYAVATVCFVGKSLHARGGQNPAEPILAGRPVVFGPAMENFATLARQLLAADGATQVENEGALAATLEKLLGDPALGRAQVERATGVLRLHEGATRRTAERLLSEPCPAPALDRKPPSKN